MLLLKRKTMSEESYNYLYVTLPQVAPNVEMINLLTPILNAEDNGKNHNINIRSIDNSISHSDSDINVNDGSDIQNHLNNNGIKRGINYESIIIDTKHHQEQHDEFSKVRTDTDQLSDQSQPLISGGDIDSKRHERLQKDIMRKKLARMRETEEQRMERLQKDRERKKLSRQNETIEQRQRRLEKDRIRIQRRRALESDEERKRRLEKNRISKRNARIKENSRFRS